MAAPPVVPPPNGLHNLAYNRAPEIAKILGDHICKLSIIVGEVATSREKVSEVPPTYWMGVGDTVVAKTEKLNMAEIAPYWSYIPKIGFLSMKLLGAGGFGAVHKVAYKPTNLICTMKLVACTLFQRHKQACIDKVVASVIGSPFLVKYYSCYCTRHLPTDECRIVMAQLEHMHLRGLVHRDIKVSNAKHTADKK